MGLIAVDGVLLEGARHFPSRKATVVLADPKMGLADEVRDYRMEALAQGAGFTTRNPGPKPAPLAQPLPHRLMMRNSSL
jgi:hypothetical protein